MADEEHSSGSISYSIKELLDGIKTSIDRLYVKLDTKADRTELVELSKKVQYDSKRVDVLETTRQVEVTNEGITREWTKWIVPSFIALAMMVISILQFLRGGK